MQSKLFGLLVLLGGVSTGDVIIQPKFGHPYVFAERIVFTSVDGRRLIAIDKSGKERWELGCAERLYEQRLNDKALVIQCGRKVSQVDVGTGAQTELPAMPEFQLLEIGPDGVLLSAIDTRFDHNRFQVLDPVQRTIVWESSTIEHIVHVTPSTVVAVTADRTIGVPSSYTLANAALRGYARLDGRVRWSIPLADPNTAGERSAVVGHLLAVIEGFLDSALLVLNPETGEVLARRKGRFLDLWAMDDSLAVLENRGSAGEAEVYFCKLPDCNKITPLHLSAKEILRFRIYGDYVLTAGIYDSACFSRSTGKRLWQKGQIEWSKPFGTEMVVTNFSSKGQAARIVSIDLSSGAERVLYSRRVTKEDRAAAVPW